ncbi:ABC transporter G family member 20 [Anthophora quadrimaculata]
MVIQQAIIVRNARKQYAKGVPILNGLSLNVPKGCIYGLLGASGCGKTTLLTCVVGVKKLDSGEIWVLGGKPGTKDSGIPGPRVGFMPQDVSLVAEFSTIGALYFFGRINGLDDQIIVERYAFLKDLLQLPPKSRLVKDMSGGQQRRVSFAAALLHKPELLILDEPTVGLDPVLRDNIWNYLVKLTHEDGVTVIITTHYIEEAKQADKIGLLRCGLLLAETSPRELLEQWNTDSLEEAFLNLSELQANNPNQSNAQMTVPSLDSTEITNANAMYESYSEKKQLELRSNSKKRCHALLVKNSLQFVRHPGGVLFSLILPMLQMMCFFNAVGQDPKELTMYVVNHEAGDCSGGKYRGNVFYNETDHTCDFVDLSCRFLSGINDSVVEKMYYDKYEDALEDITKHKTVGIMQFKKNFSSSLQEMLEDVLSVSDQTIISSRIEMEIHNPDRQINLFVQRKLYESFFYDYENIMRECKIPPKYADVPIRFEDPVYGTKDQGYLSFVTPPFLLSTMFIMATSICSSIIITDRHSGVWDRVLVQGVKTPEILITHLTLQIIVILLQVTVTLCFAFLEYDAKCEGSMAIVIFLAVLEGICGMCYGFLISIMCTSHTLVNYASVGSFYPLILLCGMVWPIEGMPAVLRWFSLSLPLTTPGMSLRAVLEKGYALDEPEVFTGVLVVLAWIACFTGICLFQLRVKTT